MPPSRRPQQRPELRPFRDGPFLRPAAPAPRTARAPERWTMAVKRRLPQHAPRPAKAVRTPRHGEARAKLPIYKLKGALLETVRQNATTVLIGETGSGKSTQLPQFLLDGGVVDRRQKIACTQPRRVAAATVAARVAEEYGCALGSDVGYAIRFEDRTSPATRIKYCTDGVLLREATVDPLLRDYGIVVLDEAHERSLQTDILLGLVKRAQARRPELKVIVMSATLQADVFQQYFPGACLFRVPGRQHPVDVQYTVDPVDDYVDAAAQCVLQIHEDSGAERGDILVFLPGQDDIEACAQLLQHKLAEGGGDDGDEAAVGDDGDDSDSDGDGGDVSHGGLLKTEAALRLLLCPLYAGLAADLQQIALAPSPPNARKVILSTNIAETSVTIGGVRHVVDTGLVKQRLLSASGVESLKVCPCSRAAASQRAGRAGREGPGHCYRLYTEGAHDNLAASDVPEIQRCALGAVVLQLKALGVERPQDFAFIAPPPRHAMLRALAELHALGALDGAMALTAKGRRMACLPLSPSHANVLLASGRHGCTAEALSLVAMVSATEMGPLLVSPRGKAQRSAAQQMHRRVQRYEGEAATLVAAYRRYHAARCGRRAAEDAASGPVDEATAEPEGDAAAREVSAPEDAAAARAPAAAPGRNVGTDPAARRRGRRWCEAHFVSARVMERAWEVRRQLASLLRRRGELRALDAQATCGDDGEALLRCVAEGFFLRVALRSTPDAVATGSRAAYRCFRVGGGHGGAAEAFLHPSSQLRRRKLAPRAVVYTELLVTSKTYLRGATAIDPAWLTELMPQLFRGKPAATPQGGGAPAPAERGAEAEASSGDAEGSEGAEGSAVSGGAGGARGARSPGGHGGGGAPRAGAAARVRRRPRVQVAAHRGRTKLMAQLMRGGRR